VGKWRDIYFKQAPQRKTFKEATLRPKAAQTTQKLIQQAKSNSPLRELGIATDATPISLAEEFRQAHIHILGTTREGKSRLIESLVRDDINNGYGACVLDPSDNGDTVYHILRYCIAQGYEKVCLIDPHDANVVIPTLNPLQFRGKSATDAVIANIMESIRLLWGGKDFSETARIQTYLPALLKTLYWSKATIPDALFFTSQTHAYQRFIREKMIAELHPHDEARMVLEDIFAASPTLWSNEFRSSARRLNPFFKFLPRLIYGSTETPLDFKQMISDKWLVLVNLDKKRLWGTEQQRLLGTLIINEIVTAIMDLAANAWQGRYYLYIDEAGQFATRVLSDIMAYQGKSGLWATVSHQFYGQFEDKQVLDAVENLTKIKILFYTPNYEDRLRMLKDMYGGALKPEEVSYNLSALKKQYAVFKIGKEAPVVTRVKDIDTPKISTKLLADFKENKIYKVNPWYRTQESVLEEINKRFAQPTPKSFRRDKAEPRPKKSDPHVPAPNKVPDHKATGATDAGKPRWKDIKTAFDKEPG
jgi:hypothetical protein